MVEDDKSLETNFTTTDAIHIVENLINADSGFMYMATSLGNGHDALQTHPYVSLVQSCFIRKVPYIFISDLSDHSKNIQTYKKISLLLDGTIDGSSLYGRMRMNSPRATFIGRVELVDKNEHKSKFLEKHKKARGFFDFLDFNMYRLNVESIRLNGGFAKAAWIRTSIDDQEFLKFDTTTIGI